MQPLGPRPHRGLKMFVLFARCFLLFCCSVLLANSRDAPCATALLVASPSAPLRARAPLPFAPLRARAISPLLRCGRWGLYLLFCCLFACLMFRCFFCGFIFRPRWGQGPRGCITAKSEGHISDDDSYNATTGREIESPTTQLFVF